MSGFREPPLWRSPDPAEPVPPEPSALPLPDRRSVLRLTGASLALAAAAGCDEAEIPGDPLHAPARAAPPAGDGLVATALELEGLARGVLVRLVGGRPVKVLGNPAHPASLGATDVFAEAAVLTAHDPNRSQSPRREGRAVRAFPGLRAALGLRDGDGAGLRIVTGPSASPTLRRLAEAAVAAWPGARWHVHDPLRDEGAAEGARLAFGQDAVPLYDLARARCVLSLGADLLGEGPAQIRHARDWSRARAEGREAGRLPTLIAVESTPGLTGARADRRLALRPAEVEPFARAVAAALDVAPAAPAHPEAAAIAAALRRTGPEALVAAGRGQPAVVHALAAAMNAALGSRAVRHVAPVLPDAPGMAPLLEEMAAGAVRRLLLLGVNPAYDTPGFAAALARVPASLHAGLYVDETALLAGWHLPLAHALEAWGDARAFDGTAAIRQPATLPMRPEMRSAEAILADLAGLPGDGPAPVQATWRAAWGEAGFEDRWNAALEAGAIEGSAAPPLEVALRPGWDPGPSPAPPPGLAAVFVPDPGTGDGGGADNAWLQELPRPLTKLAWGNAALLSPATAEALGLRAGDEVEIALDGRRVTAPVWPTPGHAPDTVTLPLGQGRPTAPGAEAATGFDAYRLRGAAPRWVAHGVTLRPTGERRRVIATQSHHTLDHPGAVRTVTPGGTVPAPPEAPSLYPGWEYREAAWGMAIDLDSCIGCNACVLACQAENNIPVVGPEEVARGREMHWLRIDRYHAGPVEAPETHFQPVPCMHCEKAPCEPACPVNATVHDSDGLNVMVYARCIGTRTCSNNCPYKVRRFNWVEYARQPGAAPVRAPDVPRRVRGVMEKCTYCSHRIANARSAAGAEGRPLRGDEVTTACQQACPTRAIAFGDLNDPGSAVARARREGRHYAMLDQLALRPRTTYLARVMPPEEGA